MKSEAKDGSVQNVITVRPNIIWVFGDQHRAQALSCSGDPTHMFSIPKDMIPHTSENGTWTGTRKPTGELRCI